MTTLLSATVLARTPLLSQVAGCDASTVEGMPTATGDGAKWS